MTGVLETEPMIEKKQLSGHLGLSCVISQPADDWIAACLLAADWIAIVYQHLSGSLEKIIQ